MLVFILFLVFLHICFCFFVLIIYAMMMLENISLFTCLSNIGKLAYVGCYENTWNTNKTKRKTR